jgi:YVTN family beta-propeller protein
MIDRRHRRPGARQRCRRHGITATPRSAATTGSMLQFSNTLSVTDPATNTLLGVIKLGDPQPANFSPLYKGHVLVHGLGFSPDGRTLAMVSIGSNSVTWIDTATNAVKHTTYVGRSPHEAFFRRTARRCGSPYAARTISLCSTPERTRRPVALRRLAGQG